jgi:hypothetical protein
MTPSLDERVATGARWLDSILPGWHRTIDTSMLDLDSCCNCILGQLFDKEAAPGGSGPNGYTYAAYHYGGARADWDTGHHWALRNGFVKKDGPDGESVDEIEDAWLDLIAERLQAEKDDERIAARVASFVNQAGRL